MKIVMTPYLLAGAIALSAGPTHGAPQPEEYVSTAAMTSAGVSLDASELPGHSVSHWLEKPESEVQFLAGDWTELLGEVHQLGDVSVLSGNHVVMHLATGQYDPFRGGEGHALVLNQGIDLRLFPGHWEYGLAVLPAADTAPGFVFFNGAGEPVHRILLTESSDLATFETLVATYASERPEFSPWSEAPAETKEATAETKAAFLEDWRGLTDTHAFSRLLRKYQLSRTDALRLAEGEFTQALDAHAYRRVFSELVDQEISIIFFALNNGCVQISTGALTELNTTRKTIQLVERDSRTLIGLDGIAEVWRVSKPTKRGLAHSLELYDRDGEPVAYIFGTRKEDEANATAFETLVFSLPPQNAQVAAASSEGEGATCSKSAAAPADSEGAASPVANDSSEENESAPKVTAAMAPIDTFNLPRRLRSQLNYTVKRLLEYDADGDEQLTTEELPRRMASLLEKGNQNGDRYLDKEELTAMAYHQIQAREAEAESQSTKKH